MTWIRVKTQVTKEEILSCFQLHLALSPAVPYDGHHCLLLLLLFQSTIMKGKHLPLSITLDRYHIHFKEMLLNYPSSKQSLPSSLLPPPPKCLVIYTSKWVYIYNIYIQRIKWTAHLPIHKLLRPNKKCTYTNVSSGTIHPFYL